jgi:hypothetical protein
MNVLGPIRKDAIGYWTKMVSGESEWFTREEIMDEMNLLNTYDNVDVTLSPIHERHGMLWYGFRLKAFKQGKPERKMIIDGELETLKEREDIIVDILYYFKDNITFDLVWDHWTKNECVA